jgi:hypothetical protein
MPPLAPAPSRRLLRAAAAEREALGRHRDQLRARREELLAELRAVDGALREIDERDDLLRRLEAPTSPAPVEDAEERARDAALASGFGPPETPAATPTPPATPTASTPRPPEMPAATPAPPATPAAAPRGRRTSNAGLVSDTGTNPALGAAPAPTPLRGPAIRHAAVRVLLEHPDRPDALHYRDWFALLQEAGHAVAGKDPLAVFLTQLSRSPAITKGTQSGVYALDRGAPQRLRARLAELHDRLRRLTATTGPTADLAGVRARRAQVSAEITRTEKELEEADAVLAGTTLDLRSSVSV